MVPSKIKICGINDISNYDALQYLSEIDYIGFIFYANSPRNVSISIEGINVKERVGVFVNETIERILDIVEAYNLDFVQLHGNETPAFCKLLSEKVKVIKAFGIDEQFDFSELVKFEKYVSFFIFDTKTILHGGAGIDFDWSLMSKYNGRKPFLLSGGIGMEHLVNIKNFQHEMCMGVDLNSKFEIRPGQKDMNLINEFLSKIK